MPESSKSEFLERTYPAFSVVLPVYNEELAIAATLDDIHKTLTAAGCEYEIIAVNDGSTDNTGRILRSRTDIKLVEHGINRGYGAALKTGISTLR